MHADGWQVVVYLERLTPKQWLLSDRGETLSKAIDAGVKSDSKKARETISALRAYYGFELDGMVAKRVVDAPFDISEFQIFAEGLVSIGHRFPPKTEAIPINPGRMVSESVNAFFYERKLMPTRNHSLTGKIESEIVVDYYLEQESPVALQPITRGKELKPFMEQWGFRWNDLRDAHPDIKRVMIFDPDNQEWDARSLRIGESVCDLFVPYSETDAVAELIA